MFRFKVKIVLCFLLLLLIDFQLHKTLAQGYKIHLNIKGASNQKVQFGYYQGDNQYVIQNSNLDKNGKLSLIGKETIPTGIYLLVIDSVGYFDLLIRNEMEFSISADRSNLYKSLSVKSSEENRLFFDYQRKVFDKKNKLSKIDSLIEKSGDSEKGNLNIQKAETNNDLLNLVSDMIKTNPKSYFAKILRSMDVVEPDSMDFADPELLRTPFYHNMIRLFIKKNINSSAAFIINETDKLLRKTKGVEANYQYLSGYLLNFYSSFYKNGMNQVFVHIADNYFLPDKAKWLSEDAIKMVIEKRNSLSQGLPGTPAVDLIMESNTGEFFSLHQVKSKTTLLYFWSVGCTHCTISTKILLDNYKALKSKDIEIFAVNIDKDKDGWIKKVEESDLPWINCFDPQETSGYRDKYYVYGSPILFEIDKEKKIVSVINGENEIEAYIKKTIGN
jgi:peroxiredoxin